MKKIFVFVIIFATLFAMPARAENDEIAADGVNVTINGAAQAFDVPPQIIDGRTMLPLRAIGEALGMEVGFDDETNTAILTAAGVEILHEIRTAEISVNGMTEIFDVPSVIIDSRTLVPVRMLAEAVGADVEWDNATRTAAIVTAREISSYAARTMQFGGREWRVLDERGGYALLLSETPITNQPYHHADEFVTWAESSSRAWLNGAFLNGFSAEERARIRETYAANNNNPWTWEHWGVSRRHIRRAKHPR